MVYGDINDINYSFSLIYKIEDILSEVFGEYCPDPIFEPFKPTENLFYISFFIPAFTKIKGEELFTKISSFLKKYERWGLVLHFTVEEKCLKKE